MTTTFDVWLDQNNLYYVEINGKMKCRKWNMYFGIDIINYGHVEDEVRQMLRVSKSLGHKSKDPPNSHFHGEDEIWYIWNETTVTNRGGKTG